MPRLDCNLTSPTPSHTGRNIMLAVLGIALAGSLAWRERLLERIEVGQLALAKQRNHAEHARRLSASSPQPVISPDTAAELNNVADELTRDWEAPLDSLRRAAGNQITLDKIRREPETGRISLQGHAASAKNYLLFLQRLQASRDWRNVLPVSDEPETGNGQVASGIRFELSGQWSGS